MTKFKNVSGKFNSFCIPLPNGPFWINAEPNEIVEVPDAEAWRARASGFEAIEGKIEEKKPIEVPKKKDKLLEALSKIKGLGEKVLEEIAEEYASVDEIVADIKAHKFRVGGIDKKKEELILKTFK